MYVLYFTYAKSFDTITLQQHRGLFLRARPGVFSPLFVLWRLLSACAPWLLLAPVALVADLLVGGVLVSSVRSCEAVCALLKSFEEAAELAVASWHSARAAVCLWSHGSSSSPSLGLCGESEALGVCSGLLWETRRLRFNGSSNEHSGSGRWSLARVERLRGAGLSSLLSSFCSDEATGHGSETDWWAYRPLSTNLKETKQNRKLKKVPYC